MPFLFAPGGVAQTPPGNAAYEQGDYSQAFQIFREQAAQGQATAQFNLGVMYLEGQGVARDYGEAVSWFRRAAEQGLAQAQFELGNLYVQHRGVKRDYDEAVSWWRKAAGQGDVRAQHALGVQYSIGRGPGWGLDRDDEQAASWWRMAAAKGHAPSQYELGLSYLEGRGVGRDRETGLMWLLLAGDKLDAGPRYDPDLVAREKRRLGVGGVESAMKRAEACRNSQFSDCD